MSSVSGKDEEAGQEKKDSGVLSHPVSGTFFFFFVAAFENEYTILYLLSELYINRVS